MAFDLNELINNPQFQTGLGLMGAASPKNRPLLDAFTMLQAMQQQKLKAEMEKARIEEDRARTEAYKQDVLVKQRQQEAMEKALGALPGMFPEMGGGEAQAPQQQPTPQLPTPGSERFNPAVPYQMPETSAVPEPLQPQIEVGKYGTPKVILQNLKQIESGGNPLAMGPILPEGDRALGAYQFRQGTVDMLSKQGMKFDPMNPKEAEDAADFYLQQLYKKHGNWEKALADYGGFKTKDPTKYVSQALGGYQAPQPQQPPGQPQLTAQAGQLAGAQQLRTPESYKQYQRMLVEGAKVQFAAGNATEAVKLLVEARKPQTIQPNTYQTGPQGDLQYIPDPAQEKERQRKESEFVQGPEQAQKIELAKGLANEYMTSQVEARKASGRKAQMQMLDTYLQSLNTGKFTPLTTEARLWMKAAGIDVDPNTPNAQIASMIGNTLAMAMRDPSQGAGSPGQVTEWEQKQFQALTPNIDKDPRTNKLLAKAYVRQQERVEGVAKIYRDYKKAHGGKLDEGVYDEIAKFVESNPLFDKEEVNAIVERSKVTTQPFQDNDKERRYQEWKARQGK